MSNFGDEGAETGSKEEAVVDYEATWPSVNLAYEFVKPSYDWAIHRLNAVDSRIQTFLAFSSTLT